MALSHAGDSDIESVHDDYEPVRGDYERLSFPPVAGSGGSESWYMMQESEMEDFDWGPSTPPPTDLSENELEEVMLSGGIFSWQQPSIGGEVIPLDNVSESSDFDELMDSQSESSISGGSDGTPSPASPTAISSVYRDSPDSTGRSDCENQPISPCDSPCFSRPGSPWPMFARPSFKKTRSPFWTTFRVREFR